MPNLATLETAAYNALSRMSLKVEREVVGILREAFTRIQGEMSVIYGKYAVAGKLTYAEMSKYNRLKSLQESVLSQLDKTTKLTIKEIDHLRTGIYRESFYRYAWAMDNGNGVRLSYGLLDKEIIKQNLINPFYTDLARVRLPFVIRQSAMAAINNRLTVGKSFASMARDLRATGNLTYYNALRIIRTEAHTAMTAAQNELYRRAGEKGIQGENIWDATLDGRTRQTHAAMDQIARDEQTGLFNGPGSNKCPYPGYFDLPPEERVHCRCRLRYQVTGYSPVVRRTRDQGLIPYQNYDEWKSNYGG